MRYKNLIFDLYGTLVEIHTEEELPQVWEKLRLFYGYHGAAYTADELFGAYRRELAARNMRAGQSYEGYPDLPVEPVLAELFRAKGVTDGLEALADTAAQLLRIESTIFVRLYPNVLEGLQRLHEAGFRLYLLSNAQAAFTRRELTLLGLDRAFDRMFLSSDYGIRKPDPDFIGTLLREEGLAAKDCLMIGNDMSTDIAGAAAVGVDGLFVKTNMALGEGPCTWTLEGNDWATLAEEIIRL